MRISSRKVHLLGFLEFKLLLKLRHFSSIDLAQVSSHDIRGDLLANRLQMEHFCCDNSLKLRIAVCLLCKNEPFISTHEAGPHLQSPPCFYSRPDWTNQILAPEVSIRESKARAMNNLMRPLTQWVSLLVSPI